MEPHLIGKSVSTNHELCIYFNGTIYVEQEKYFVSQFLLIQQNFSFKI